MSSRIRSERAIGNFRLTPPGASVHISRRSTGDSTINGEAAVIRLISALWLMSMLAAGTAWAQPYTPNQAGITMGHWHLNSRDIEANKKIFVAMGGTASKTGELHRVTFPGVVVILNLPPGAAPATGPTEGTVINHVGFVVPNVQESVAKWKAAGVPVQPGGNNRLDQAFVVTPDGLKVEILQDKNQSIPIRHEHVHFFLPESAIPLSQAWYGKTFGASRCAQRGAVATSPYAVALCQGRHGQHPHQGAGARPHRLRRVDLQALCEARRGRNQTG